MAVHTVETGERSSGWRPRPLGLLLIGVADFCGAVGLGNLVFGQAAALWLVVAAAVLLAGIAALD